MADVSTPCLAYEEVKDDWVLPRTLMGGTKSMRKAGVTYLPIEPKESVAAYQNRLNRTTLFNAFGRAVKTLTGKMYTNPVVVGDDIHSDIKPLMEDVDRQGRDLSRFMWDVTEDAMQVGIAHILVDHPIRPEGVVSRADEKANGLRPYWVHIKAENLIGWKFGKVGGVSKLIQIRIKETTVEADGEWGEKTVERIRVLGIGTWELHRKTTKASGETVWIMEESGTNTMKDIPLVSIYTNRVAALVGTPPLEDLAQLNIAHWQSSSDQRAILHVARVPLLFGAGFDEDDGAIEISASRMIKGPQGATLAYVEHKGDAIEAGQADLDHIETQMAILAMEPMLQKQSGTATATGKAIDTAEAHSLLQAIAMGVEDSLEQAIRFTGAWLNIAPEACGGAKIDCDFNLLSQDAADITELGKAALGGIISYRAYTNELKRRGRLSEEYDFDADRIEINSQAPALGLVDPSTKDQQMSCPDCHCVMPKDAAKCPDCGKDMSKQPTKKEMKK